MTDEGLVLDFVSEMGNTYGLLGDDLRGGCLHGLLLSGSVDLRHVDGRECFLELRDEDLKVVGV